MITIFWPRTFSMDSITAPSFSLFSCALCGLHKIGWHKSPCKNLQVETQWVGHSVAQTLLYEIELFSNILTLRGHFAADCKWPLMKCISNFLNSWPKEKFCGQIEWPNTFLRIYKNYQNVRPCFWGGCTRPRPPSMPRVEIGLKRPKFLPMNLEVLSWGQGPSKFITFF